MSTMERTHGIENQGPPRIAAGVATILFPVLLTAGFALHPHLFTPRMTTTAAELVTKFHGQVAFHVGHTIVLAAVPFIIVMFMSVMAALGGRGKRLGSIGGLIGIVGAVILAADKGALCLVLSAFDSLSGPISMLSHQRFRRSSTGEGFSSSSGCFPCCRSAPSFKWLPS